MATAPIDAGALIEQLSPIEKKQNRAQAGQFDFAYPSTAATVVRCSARGCRRRERCNGVDGQRESGDARLARAVGDVAVIIRGEVVCSGIERRGLESCAAMDEQGLADDTR